MTCSDNVPYLLDIDYIVLSPNPPLSGHSLTVNASGYLKETIEDGAYVNVIVKYGLITLIKTTIDLCEKVQDIDVKCPIQKGPVSIYKTVDIPKAVPPGTYTARAHAFTNEDLEITCLAATVQFPRN